MNLKTFRYEALNAEGQKIKGKIDALNRGVSIRYLQSKGLNVKRISESAGWLVRLSSISVGKVLSSKDLVFFLKQLAALLVAGVNIVQALELLSLQSEKPAIKKLYFELYQLVFSGINLSKALSQHPKEFPALLIQMVQIGELSGELPPHVARLADYFENQNRINAQIQGALRMPIIYLIAALLISAGMLLFVFPNITSLFKSFGDAKLPAITQFFIDAGMFVSSYSFLIFGSLFAIITTIIVLNKKSPKARMEISKFVLSIPIVGRLIQMNNQIQIANSLSQMLSSGITSTTALETIRDFTENPVFKDLIVRTLKNIEDGRPFAKSFEENKYVDPIMSRMIATGERTGDIPRLLENLSKYYNGINEMRVEQIKNAIQPILLLVVYAIVGVMILAVMMPMLSLGSQIG